jgi:hypothetical protein
MSVNTPPTENIPIFDASVFPSASGTSLTIASGSKYFLTYPVAQGSEIFPSNITLQSTLTDSSGDVGTAGQVLSSTGTGTSWVAQGAITGNLDLPPPYGLLTDTITQSASHVSGSNINLYGTSTDSDILIGSTLPALKTLRLCNTTAGSSGGSVHCANVGFDGSHINNATDPTGVSGGNLKLGQLLTSGPLYIGGGAATAVHTTGPIIIGSDSTATGGINIGTGTNTTVPTVNTVNIGSATYGTNVLGTLTTSSTILANGNITASGSVLIGQTVRNALNTGSISQGGVLTGTSVISPSFNASANTDSVGICSTQTTGVLNIGTGVRDITGSGGAINIGTGAGANANPINIGGAGTVTTFTNGLSLASSKYITTSHSGTFTSPLATQVGGIITGSSLSTSGPTTSGRVNSIGQIDLTIGVWILTATRAYNNSNLCTRVLFSFGSALRTNDTANAATDYLYGLTTPPITSATFYANLSGFATLTTASSIYLNVTSEFSTAAAYPTSNFVFSAIRIA